MRFIVGSLAFCGMLYAWLGEHSMLDSIIMSVSCGYVLADCFDSEE